MKTQLSNTILLVEDNRDDAYAFRYALKRIRIMNPLQVVTDGQQAIDYLSGVGPCADRKLCPLPFVIFLDLKLPYVDGFDVLSWIRAQRELDSIDIIMLSGSAEDRDQDGAFKLGARSYLVKPPTAETLSRVFESVDNLWHSSQWISKNAGAAVARV
jgi:CheY-like chemotaxis protein